MPFFSENLVYKKGTAKILLKDPVIIVETGQTIPRTEQQTHIIYENLNIRHFISTLIANANTDDLSVLKNTTPIFQREVEEFCCPITLMPMQCPVVASDGVSYEKKALEKWLNMEISQGLTPFRGRMVDSNDVHLLMPENTMLNQLITEHVHRLAARNIAYPRGIDFLNSSDDSWQVLLKRAKLRFEAAIMSGLSVTMSLLKFLHHRPKNELLGIIHGTAQILATTAGASVGTVAATLAGTTNAVDGVMTSTSTLFSEQDNPLQPQRINTPPAQKNVMGYHSTINIDFPFSMTETESAFIHVLASKGHWSDYFVGGHSTIVMEYIKDGSLHLVVSDIQAVPLDKQVFSYGDGYVTNVKCAEYPSLSVNNLMGLASWRVKLSCVETLINNIKNDIMITVQALANIFLAVEKQLKSAAYLKIYQDFLKLSEHPNFSGYSLMTPEAAWLQRCENMLKTKQHLPTMDLFLKQCAKKNVDDKEEQDLPWIHQFIKKMQKNEITSLESKQILMNSNLLKYRFTGSGPLLWLWAGIRENPDDPLNCSQWIKEHLYKPGVDIDITNRKNKPFLLTCTVS